MGSLARIRVSGLVAALALVAGGAAASRANEVEAGAPATGLVIHDADETLARYCVADPDGRLWLELPGGLVCELVTSTTDPAISNPGDGSFHPFDPLEVRAALSQVRFPLAQVRAEIYLLPYPRRNGLESAAGPGLMLLSPGVYPIPVEHQHAQVAHELGHIVHFQMLPEADVAGWTRYRTLRGITDLTIYSATSVHADRPHEIFAEDFRALFGGALANYSGSIENSTIEPPAEVAGLDDFMLGLAGAAPALTVSAWPNPARGAVRFSRAGRSAAPLDVFDVSGRRLASLDPAWDGATTVWAWDGRPAGASARAIGVFWARPRDGASPALRVTLAR